MIQLRSFAVLAALALAIFFLAPPAAAQDQAFTVGVLGGIGGTEDSGYDQTNVQAFFAFEMSPKTHFAVRVGQMMLDGEEGLAEGDLGWVTLSTEYRIPAGFYESGLFIGLGYYRLQSDDGVLDDSAFGLNLGVTGDIPLTRHLSLMIELSGHYADLDASQILLMGQAGLAVHF